MEQRLQKILAAAGVASRRQCEVIIAGGRVSVNGKIITELGAKADPDVDKISVDGEAIELGREKIYLLLNKPTGYTTTRSDPHAEHTVMELVGEKYAHLHPVGRLDVDTSGLLLFTNDGDLTNLLTHPSHEIDKTYVAQVQGRISSEALSYLAKGVQLNDGLTAPARARLISYSRESDMSTVELIIHEGRNRQVRRMFMHIDHRVLKLSRSKLGNLDLKGVREGEYRPLTKKEVAELRKQL